MMPRLGEKYKDIEIDVMSKPMAEYQSEEYFELENINWKSKRHPDPFQEYRTEEYAKLGLPKAPAIMVNDENQRWTDGIE